MPQEYTPMKGDEFVRKVLEGERDFRRVALEQGFDFSEHEGYAALKKYFKEESYDLEENPLDLCIADMRRVRIPDMVISYLRANLALFDYAVLSGSMFSKVDFRSAQLRYAELQGVNFLESDLSEANFYCADLASSTFACSTLTGVRFIRAHLKDATIYGANVTGAQFDLSDLNRADLRGVENLDRAFGLDRAHFLETRVSREDRGTVKKALKERKPIIYKGFFD